MPLKLSELDQLRAIIHRIAALLILRPQLDGAYEKATDQAWGVEDLLVSEVLGHGQAIASPIFP